MRGFGQASKRSYPRIRSPGVLTVQVRRATPVFLHRTEEIDLATRKENRSKDPAKVVEVEKGVLDADCSSSKWILYPNGQQKRVCKGPFVRTIVARRRFSGSPSLRRAIVEL